MRQRHEQFVFYWLHDRKHTNIGIGHCVFSRTLIRILFHALRAHLPTRRYILRAFRMPESRFLLEMVCAFGSVHNATYIPCLRNVHSSPNGCVPFISYRSQSISLLFRIATENCTSWRNGRGENRCACFPCCYSISTVLHLLNSVMFRWRINARYRNREIQHRKKEKIFSTQFSLRRANRLLSGRSIEILLAQRAVLRTWTICVQLNFMNGRDRQSCACSLRFSSRKIQVKITQALRLNCASAAKGGRFGYYYFFYIDGVT